MEHQTKLIECQDLQGNKLSFVILSQQILGKGSYGSVKKAYQQNYEHEELAVKIIKYGDEKSKNDISRQIEVLRNLDDHPNLVRVKPLQCFSNNNFYIFMEFCNQGTLSDQMRSKFVNRENFMQSDIFKAFYEILKGYEVLWKKGILHQDLKPDNILIHNGTYKIADFGFSIYYKNVKLERIRLGTCDYMPLEKLTKPDYVYNTKSDVFSLGVIFFKMITGKHPYVLQKYTDYKEYLPLLKKNELTIPPYIKSRLSIPMQELFDLILRMVAKCEKNRIDFDQIYQFMNDHEVFIELEKEHNRESSKFYSVQLDISKQSETKPPVRFVQVSKAFMIPFSIPKSQEEEYLNKLKQVKLKVEQKAQIESIIKIQKYLCSMRIMVYFFDRLTRRLFVEKRKKEMKSWKENDVAQIEQKAILGLVHTAKKITTKTVEDIYYQRVFSPEEWRVYKKTQPALLKLIEKDKQFLVGLANELAMQTKQSKILDRHKIINSSNKPLLQFLTGDVRDLLIALLRTRISLISIDDKNKQQLITIYYILTAVDIIDNFKERNENWQQLEGVFRKMESEELVSLIEKVILRLEQLGLHYSLDVGGCEES